MKQMMPLVLVGILALIPPGTLQAANPSPPAEANPPVAAPHQATLDVPYDAAYCQLMRLLVAKNYIILGANRDLGTSQAFGFITFRTQSERESGGGHHDTILTGTLLLKPASVTKTQVEVKLTTNWQTTRSNNPFEAGVQEDSAPDMYRGFLEMISKPLAP